MFLFFWLWGIEDLSSLTRDGTLTLCLRRQSLNHWAAREVPSHHIFIKVPIVASRPCKMSPWPLFHLHRPPSYTGCLSLPLSIPHRKPNRCLRAFALALPSASLLSPRFLPSGSSDSLESLLKCHSLRQDFRDCFWGSPHFSRSSSLYRASFFFLFINLTWHLLLWFLSVSLTCLLPYPQHSAQ